MKELHGVLKEQGHERTSAAPGSALNLALRPVTRIHGEDHASQGHPLTWGDKLYVYGCLAAALALWIWAFWAVLS